MNYPGGDSPESALSIAEIERRLAKTLAGQESQPVCEFPSLHELRADAPRTAAVLIPLFQIDTAWHLLFTRRTADLPEHSGQVAFPGGRSDPEDTNCEMTALREAFEEIGLAPQHVRILGRLREYLTITNYLVTPVVGVIPWPYPFTPEYREVARVFTIPLNWLGDRRNHEEIWRTLPMPYARIPVIYFQEYDGEILWGATARFTLALLDAIK